MSKNPFLRSKQTAAASEFRFGTRSERMLGANGEVNASSKADLLKQITALLAASASGEVAADSVVASAEKRAKRQEALASMFKSPAKHAEIGEVMADDLFQAANREGFARRFLTRQELSQGQIPRVAMRMKNAVAVVASSASRANIQNVRDNIYTPPEFYIQARPFVEARDIQQSTSDLLEEKFVEATEGIMVAEDRLWYRMAKDTSGLANAPTIVSGSLSPKALADQRNLVTRWNIPSAHWLIANDIWSDIVGNTDFSQLIDPVSKAELLLTGQLGTILGMSVISDGYRHPQHRVLSQGDTIIVGDAINHGMITDRGGIESTPIDVANEGIPGRGWHLMEMVSMVVANARSVSFGKRVA